jgi:phage-related protein
MPVARPLGGGLFEVRTDLTGNRISRVIFYIDVKRRMVLLHGFIKKTRRTPAGDLDLAIAHKAQHEKGLKSPK